MIWRAFRPLLSSHFALLTVAALISCSAAKARSGLLVVLDPGHGGEDTGAIRQHLGAKVFEKDITLAIALATARALKAKGIETILTRNGDRFVTLDQRAERANRALATAKNTIFVSIHANSSDDTRSSGLETYVLNATNNQVSQRLADLENGKRPPGLKREGRGGGIPQLQQHGTLELIFSDLATTANYGDSVNLACSVQQAVAGGFAGERSPIRNRGIRQALFYVLMQTRMPSILFEPGFVSNPEELARLLSPKYQARVALGLTRGIMMWASRSRLAQRNSHRPASWSGISKSHCQVR